MPQRYLPASVDTSGALDGFDRVAELEEKYDLDHPADARLGLCHGGVVFRCAPRLFARSHLRDSCSLPELVVCDWSRLPEIAADIQVQCVLLSLMLFSLSGHTS